MAALWFGTSHDSTFPSTDTLVNAIGNVQEGIQIVHLNLKAEHQQFVPKSNHCVGHFVANYNRAWCLKSDPRGGGREGGDGRMALGGSYITMLDAMLLTHEATA